MAGKKYKPLIIGKFKRLRCLNNFNPAIVGVDYTHSQNAWMTNTLFKLKCERLQDHKWKKDFVNFG